ncbi:glycerophosphoryl diester phosphodiesterase [Paraburkholderia sp. Clong3]|uniref:glycerophosphodiester phosphodiesterase n=1 Tax=unclassified Paraburkholderia TaxID=2615204 RepID=UPI0017C3AB67|nr:glycerophosphodiester phosphodiesterase [Paraburkholderia sp. CI2]MBB5467623.1 glycerophosphoryl diester phosphodiesterase [Paraburkholderia sp. CI2]
MTKSNIKRGLFVCAVSALLGGCGGGSDKVASVDPTQHLFFQPRQFDLQAHRGGLGLVVESTLQSFASGLETGVTTLELDTQITSDGIAVVTHDRQVSKNKCLDTGPVTQGDPLYPYVGRYIKELTLAQVKTLDCGSLRQSDFPTQRLEPGARMPTLREVFDLVKSYKADQVMMNVEIKVEAGAPSETAPRDIFVRTVLDEIRASGLTRQITIQSFDWGALMLVRKLEPTLPIVALTNGQQFLQVGVPGASPWLGGIDIDDPQFGGDLVKAAASFGADAISPVAGDPQNGVYGQEGYVPYTTPELVARAHAAGMKVIPWTVDAPATMNYLIDAKVDGLITDYPDVLRRVMASRGIALPSPVAKP